MNDLHAKINTHFKWGHAVLVVILAASLFLGSFNPAAAATGYYVSPSGNNANPGTQTQPWQTVQYAVSHVSAGDTIYLRAGTYNEAVSITASGQSGSPITLTNYNGESATINGSANPAITGGSSYWTIKGLTLTSAADRTIRLNSTTNYAFSNNKIIGAVYIWGSYNTLEGNDIDGSQHKGNENGVMDDSTNSHHNIYRRNTIHDFNNRGIWTQWLTHDNTIEYNTVYNMTATDGMCIDLDAATNVTYRHVVRGNVVHDCAQTGIELENSYDTVVENNIVYNTGYEGIQIINYQGCQAGGESSQYGETDGDCRGDLLGTTVRNNLVYKAGSVGAIVSYEAAGVKVYNNTLMSGKSVGLYLNNDTNYSHDWEVVGNIFFNNPRAEISVVNPASLSRDESNLFYHTTSNKAYEQRGTSTTYATLAEWQSKTGKGSRSIEKDPLFVNSGSFDAHLTSSSPAIDASTNTGITSDLDGKTRPSGAGYDMGAYEYGGSSPAPTATRAPTNAPTATKLPTNGPTATKLPTTAPTSASGTWVFCANENGICTFSGTAQVRYGANGIYNTLTATNSINCNNTVFGDPVPGVVKSCSYLSGSAATATKAPTSAPTATKAPTNAPTATKIPTSAPTATKAPTTVPTSTGGTWVFCASEYQTCTFPGTAQVRYGAGSSYNYLTATNSIACANEVFGDPAPGVVKTCSYLSSGGTAPTATQMPATAAPASGAQLSFTPTADAYVQSNYPTRNYGTLTKLYQDDSPKRVSYLRFDVQGLDGKTIQKAALKLYPAQTTLRALNVNRVDDNAWTETGLNYQNAPALGELITTSAKTLTNGVLIIDVTGLVQGNGELNLALSNVTAGDFTQYSRESGARSPVLEITVQ